MSLIDALSKLPAVARVDPSLFGEVEIRRLPRVQQIGGRSLARNWVSIPHVTHHDEVDVTELEAQRMAVNAQAPGFRLTLPAILLKAVVTPLREFPHFNASLDDSGVSIVLKKYFHLGVAVDTPQGLLVPVIRDCDHKPVAQIAAELAGLSARARTNRLTPDEMSGGCFSLSSIGAVGGTAFTPIINAPEVAILGATRVHQRPAPGPDGAILWRKMLPLSLSYDHRVINGVDAARFVSRLAQVLAAPRDLRLDGAQAAT